MADTMQRKAFIERIAPYAVIDMRQTGVLASVTIAQACLETGFGSRVTGDNYFGIKGAGALATTKEYVDGKWVTVRDSFVMYDGLEASVAGHSRFLLNNGRYARAGFFAACEVMDYKGACEALQRAGYATDPGYASKLIAIIEQYGLTAYDVQVKPQLGAENELETEAQDESPALAPGVAQTIIETWISPAWFATDDEQQRQYLHWLANELRKCSGIKPES